MGMEFPFDATYFDQFPLIFDEGLIDVAGRQNRFKVSQNKLEELTKASYGDDMEAKTFPHLHPWGFGGWYYTLSCTLQNALDVRGWFAHDQFYPFCVITA